MADMTKQQTAYRKYLQSMRDCGRKVGVSWTLDADVCLALQDMEIIHGKHPSLFVGEVLRPALGLQPKTIPQETDHDDKPTS